MTELITAAQMRAIEQAAIDSGEVTGLELMERAGQGVVEAIFEQWPELVVKPHRGVILCGPGNNGGDGFVVARLLQGMGWDIEVFLYGNSESLPPDSKTNHDLWLTTGTIKKLTKDTFETAISNDPVEETDQRIKGRPKYTEQHQRTIYIDALFGTGLSRKFNNELLEICGAWSQTCWENGVAIDLPSGVCSDSGEIIGGLWFLSRLVVTFQRYKLGHFLGPSLFDIDAVRCIDLGIDDHDDTLCEGVELLKQSSIPLDKSGFFDDGLQKPVLRNKFSHGHAVVASGPTTKTGAARLTARGALRIGAGLVTIASPTDALSENAAHLTAIMLRKTDSPAQFRSLLSDERITSVCVGPGFACENVSTGLDFTHTREIVEVVLNAKKKTVLDADSLSAFESDPDRLFANLHQNCVLTPHGGEFARLFPDISEKLNAPTTKGPAYSKVDATRSAAKRAGCTVLFKGADTVIADQTGVAAINSALYDRAAPWLATAGSGDVLAGFITGLLARGFPPIEAAQAAAWLHVECALKFGPGLIAEDLPEQLPTVFHDLGL